MHFTDGTIGDVGVVKILNNHVASINTMIADGRITGDNGAYATYDLSTNTTTVIPEPATLGLVGVVGVFIRKRFMI